MMKNRLTDFLNLIILILVCVSFSYTNIKGQGRVKIDSLNKVIAEYDSKRKLAGKNTLSLLDSTKVNDLYSLAKIYWGVDLDTSFIYGNQILNLSKKIGYKKGEGFGYNILGVICMYKAEHKLAIKHFQDGKLAFEAADFKSGLANILGNIGLTFQNQGDAEQAITYQLKALKIRQAIGDKKGLAVSYSNIGHIYHFQGKYNEALSYLLNGVKIFDEIGDKRNAALTYDDIGMIYRDKGAYDEALKYASLSLKMNEEVDNKYGLANSNNQLGYIYNMIKKPEDALNYYYKALKIAEAQGLKMPMANSYFYIGAIYFDKADYDVALKNYSTALQIYKEAEDKANEGIMLTEIARTYKAQGKLKPALESILQSIQLIKETDQLQKLAHAYKHAAEISSALKNYKAAFDFEVLYKQAYDSLYNNEQDKKLNKMQINFDFEKKAATLKAAQDKKDALAAEESKRQKTIRNYTLIGLALVMIFSIVVYRQRNKIAKEKKRSDQLVLDKEMLIKEIHHRVKNNLEVISSLLELQSEGIDDEKAKAAVIEGQSRVQSIALIHHKLYRTDDVSAVEFNSFVNDLYKQVASVFKQLGSEIDFEVEANQTQISIDTAVPIGLILNELLTNTFKYAIKKDKQNKIKVKLDSADSTGLCKIIYSDNGPGMPATFELKNSTSLGMKVIQLLTKQIGGKLNFYNQNGSVFEIPFKMLK
jgi:two-component sensor histidine kinase